MSQDRRGVERGVVFAYVADRPEIGVIYLGLPPAAMFVMDVGLDHPRIETVRDVLIIVGPRRVGPLLPRAVRPCLGLQRQPALPSRGAEKLLVHRPVRHRRRSPGGAVSVV